MPGLTVADYVAVVFFLFAWAGYHTTAQRGGQDGSLNSLMNGHRMRWMDEMTRRDNRIVDASLMASLQNGTAFFTSTSLIALGGAATLLRGSDDILKAFSEMPFGFTSGRGVWEVKVFGLALILGYAFFKFSWSYRLYNYSAILIGATPSAGSADAEARRLGGIRAGRMAVAAAGHFSRGQRAFLFAIGYLGWLVSAYALMATTALIVVVMFIRQHFSDARAAALADG